MFPDDGSNAPEPADGVFPKRPPPPVDELDAPMTPVPPAEEDEEDWLAVDKEAEKLNEPSCTALGVLPNENGESGAAEDALLEAKSKPNAETEASADAPNENDEVAVDDEDAAEVAVDESMPKEGGHEDSEKLNKPPPDEADETPGGAEG